MSLLRRLSTATAVATLALVALGGIVRATGSGLGCPDWPRCHGRLLPPLDFHAIVEYSHRTAAAIVGLLVLATAWVAWRRARGDRGVLWPATAAVAVVAVQAGLGRLVVVGELKVVATNIAHFVTGMLLVTLVVVTAVGAHVRGGGEPVEPRVRSLLRWSLWITGALLLVGVTVRTTGASLAFLDWPLMDGTVLPGLGGENELTHFLHRLLALAAVGAGVALAVQVRGSANRSVRLLSWIALALLAAQVLVGGAAVLSRLATPAVAAHVSLSSLAWAALVAAAAVERRGRRDRGPAEAKARARTRVGAYAQLMKPDIIVLLLVTTVPAMVLAAGRWPSWGLIAATLLGGTLAAGGANAINCFLDRDIDEVMARTRGRPIPAHRIEPDAALRFGLAISTAGIVWLAATVNWLTALLTAGAAAFYVLVYTALMKRTTPQNIVIGGAAGAAPALIGWAAVTGSLAVPAALLFAIIFAWTPPHFWALSLKYAEDYRAAGIPMLPVTDGRRQTERQILLYSVLLLSVSLLLFPAARMGPLYLVAALVLGGLFIAGAVRLARVRTQRAAMALFHYSITYLGLLFAAVAADRLLRS